MGVGGVTTLTVYVCASQWLHLVTLRWTQWERNDWMLNKLGMMLWEIPTNSNLNKLEFHFLPLSKGNTEAGSPVLVEWVLEAVRGPEYFLSLIRGPCWLLCLSLRTHSPGEGKSKGMWWLSLSPF